MNAIINHEILQLCILAMAMSFAASFAVFKILISYSVLSHPEARSNHKTPTPVGGGIGFVAITASMLWALQPYLEEPFIINWQFITAFILLALVSLADDVKGLSVRLRVFAQVVAMIMVLKLSFLDVQIWQIPMALNIAIVAIGWFWFINLYNFMDGIDGLAATEAIAIALGIAAVGYTVKIPEFFFIGLIISSAVIPFLTFNWSPAKIFMGDSGSISLGFLLGFVLISLAAKGFIAAAFILPAYFVADATVTITHRLMDGEKIWQSHSRHFYQQGVRAGLGHARVSIEIALLNLLLIGLALVSVIKKEFAFLTVIFAYMAVFSLMCRFGKLYKTKAK